MHTQTMPGVARAVPKRIFHCPYCQATYAVLYRVTATRDSGSAYCKVCRHRMKQWNAHEQPFYRLLEKDGRYDYPQVVDTRRHGRQAHRRGGFS
jgi:transcription elongation factor Elf1